MDPAGRGPANGAPSADGFAAPGRVPRPAVGRRRDVRSREPLDPGAIGRRMARSPSAIIEYTFRQRFRVPRAAAYAWATDFTPSDWKIAGLDGRRSVRILSPELRLLTDRVDPPGGDRRPRTRLIHLYPDEFAWVSTHVRGDHLHSQFRYAIRSVGPRASELTFQGREIRWERKRATAAQVRAWRRQLRAGDAALWRAFARAMEADRASP